MYTTEELFNDEQELNAFHDVLCNVAITLKLPGEMDGSKDYLVNQFNLLPVTTRDIAHCWGLSDTVFRDEAYSYLVRKGQ